MSNSQHSKLKSGTKNGTEVTLNLLSNLICDSYDEANFLYNFFLTDTQVAKLCKAFANGSSANIKLLKTQVSKILQSSGFLLPVINKKREFWFIDKSRFIITKNFTHTPQGKNAVIASNSSSVSSRCSYSKEKLMIRHDYTHNLKRRNERYKENS